MMTTDGERSWRLVAEVMEERRDEAVRARDRLAAVLEGWQDAAGELVAKYEAVLAERDELRAAEAERNKIRDLIERSSLGSPEAKALRDSMPPELARTIVLASEYHRRAEAAEAERDRLRVVVEAVERWTDAYAIEAAAVLGHGDLEEAQTLVSEAAVATLEALRVLDQEVTND